MCLSAARCSVVLPAVISWKLLSMRTCVRSTCPRISPPTAPFCHVQQASGRLFQEDQGAAVIFRGQRVSNSHLLPILKRHSLQPLICRKNIFLAKPIDQPRHCCELLFFLFFVTQKYRMGHITVCVLQTFLRGCHIWGYFWKISRANAHTLFCIYVINI